MQEQNNAPRIILASESPRRREILMMMGLEFEVRPSSADETVSCDMTPGEMVELLSQRKAETVAEGYASDAVIIAADTIVYIDGKKLGKPVCREEAVSMLKRLSGATHEVYTGITVRRGGLIRTGHEVTRVTFGDVPVRLIERYVDTERPYDKAGAYGIQGPAMVFIDRIEGDFYNVMGLPAAHTAKILRESFGVDV